MPNRENVVKGMEQFRADFKPFCGNHADWERFDAGLALLREQEAVKPYAEGDGSFACDNCGETVGWEEMNCGGISMVKYKFCPECGRAVKWDA